MELMWGVRHGRTKDEYGHRILGERQAIPAMLDLFEANGIHATWATVGFAMCEGREDLLARAPEDRPTYDDADCSGYSYIDEAGDSEAADPYYFAPSMLRRVASCPAQEIASHTFSHFYCLEPGQTVGQFKADLAASVQIIEDFGVECASIVFPRNQYDGTYLDACHEQGIKVFRGNEESWCYAPGNGQDQTPAKRLMRLADSYLPLTGHHGSQPMPSAGMVNVPSSRFLRPHHERSALLMDGLRLARITGAMTVAAKRGETYHLWWHPHNFGAETAANIAFLGRIVEHHRTLADRYGMVSQTMAEAAA
jgi:peptidoglycan/xylan/chitin deacetylase (PgdA/CDA1 family)